MSKVTIGITTLLSMTVFLMLVTESMPPTSDVLPLIGEGGYVHVHVFRSFGAIEGLLIALCDIVY